ncbi:MAG: alpha-L-fucosidase [Kiritimatiellae bacterium]|nr:alpha-L-fucosidase [Kiritimatiellia bacterium]
MRKSSLVLLSLIAALKVFALPAPTPQTQHFLNLEVVAIIHYGLNTYADKEWGYGDTPAEIFNPTKLDVNQWVQAAKAAGIKRIILVCKHHDGFCLWPSKLNKDYTVANTPWKNGKGDLVKEVREATHKAGLEFAAYLSPWDRHHAEYARPGYVEYFHAQWDDLMDNYGPITEIWLDGANGGDGWYGGARERRSLPGGAEAYYQSERLLDTLFKKSDKAVAFSGLTTDRTVTWPWNERGQVAEDYKFYRERNGKLHFCPPEADTPLRRTWFWHRNDRAKSLKELTDCYFESVGRGGVLDLGLAPNKDGLLDEGDVQRLKEFGAYIAAYKKSRAGKCGEYTVSADKMTLDLNLPEPRTFSAVEIRENLAKGGMRIGEWRIEADGVVIARGPQVGNRRIARFPEVTAKKVSLIVEKCDGKPAISDFSIRKLPRVEDFEGAEIAEVEEKIYPRGKIKFSKTGKAILGADFGKELSLSGFNYDPGKNLNDMTDYYRASASRDGKNWKVVSEAEFGNLKANPVKQSIRFSETVKARYLKIEGLKAIEGEPALKIEQIEYIAE